MCECLCAIDEEKKVFGFFILCTHLRCGFLLFKTKQKKRLGRNNCHIYIRNVINSEDIFFGIYSIYNRFSVTLSRWERT